MLDWRFYVESQIICTKSQIYLADIKKKLYLCSPNCEAQIVKRKLRETEIAYYERLNQLPD